MRLRYCAGTLVLIVAFSLSSAARPLYPPVHTATNGNYRPFVAPLRTGHPDNFAGARRILHRHGIPPSSP